MEKTTGLTTQNSGRIASLCVNRTQMRVEAGCSGGGQVDASKISQWLRARYDHDAAKLVARDLGASVRTVENWLGGQMPNAFWLLKMIVHYPPEFFVSIAPWVPDWLNAARLHEEEAALAAQMALIKARQEALRALMSAQH